MERMVTYIPPTAETVTPDKKPITKVAAYARVSTLNPEQEDSYEGQQRFYRDLINETPGWELTEIYADQASGLNTKKRTDFKRMMSDAKNGAFDLLLVKSISRFGRNTVDTISSIRELRSYGTEVRFQKESLSTASPQIEFILTVMASMAEQESLSISQNVQLAFQYKMKRGEWSCAYSTFLGYDRTPEGEIVVNEEQAKTVRHIYERFLAGVSLDHLAIEMNEEGCWLTGKGSPVWEKGTLRKILTNPKYSGVVILQQTYTADVLTKKRKKNDGKVPQYRVENGIPAIIDKQTWYLAHAELLRRAKHSTGQEAPGPRPRWGKHDFTMLIRCPKCGAFLNRHLARKTRVWKCHDRATGGSCRSEVIREEELVNVTLQAAQALWDKQPNVRHYKVPELSERSEEKTRLEAAAIHTENRLADRVSAFLQGERPTEYDPSVPKDLLESITFDDDVWTFRFWGRQTITVPRAPVGKTVDVGRKLKRSGRPVETSPQSVIVVSKGGE